ncbi:MAG: hypothetical protein MZV70_61625 [Desulfobacterales bacterium]|nr:hypothetical protein [Desulfobacterales bacterium]
MRAAHRPPGHGASDLASIIPRIILCQLRRHAAGTGQQAADPAQRQGWRAPMSAWCTRCADALDAGAAPTPSREVVFFAIGFETDDTAHCPGSSSEAAALRTLTNFTVFCNHVLTPAAMKAILNVAAPDARRTEKPCRSGRLSRAQPTSASVIGSLMPYERLRPASTSRPVVIAGFEPLDVLQSILMLVRQLNEGRAEV